MPLRPPCPHASGLRALQPLSPFALCRTRTWPSRQFHTGEISFGPVMKSSSTPSTAPRSFSRHSWQNLLRPTAVYPPCPTPGKPLGRRGVHFAAGTDEATAQGALDLLVKRRPGAGRKLQPSWQLTRNEDAVQRTFKFKTFGTAWEFMNVIAAECKKQRHHPEWSNVYNTIVIRWTTHNPPGLSHKDLSMAQFCDEQAALLGELPEESNATKPPPSKEASENESSILEVAVEEGSCGCGPKSGS